MKQLSIIIVGMACAFGSGFLLAPAGTVNTILASFLIIASYELWKEVL